MSDYSSTTDTSIQLENISYLCIKCTIYSSVFFKSYSCHYHKFQPYKFCFRVGCKNIGSKVN